MSSDRFQQLSEARRIPSMGIADERQRPAPGDEPKADFEAAGPVDPHPGRIGAKPVLQVAKESFCISLFACQPVGLAEMDQPLMAVELPDHFSVADGCLVQWVQPGPMKRWRLAS